MVDFKAMKEAARAKQATAGMLAVVMGSSGAGKSTVCGTTGRPTLVLHTKDESHGPTSASTFNDDVAGLCLDMDEEGNEVSPDVALDKLVEVLGSEDLSSNFGTVVVDSLSSIDLLIKKTQYFRNFCADPKTLKHNSFKEGEAVLTKIQDIVTHTDRIRQQGVHVLFTLAANVKSMDSEGMVETVAPVLSTYGVSESVARMFPIVLYTACVTVEGERKRAFLFNTHITRESKEVSGKIKKLMNFMPRCAGIPDSEMPEMLPADFQKLLEFIKSVKE